MTSNNDLSFQGGLKVQVDEIILPNYYDDSNVSYRPDSSLVYKFSNSILVLESKNEYIYDTNGHLESIVVFSWDMSSSTWMKSKKTVYLYGINNKIESRVDYIWNQDSEQGLWYETTKIEYLYNADGNLVKETSYAWNEESSVWNFNIDTAYTYTYNENQKLIMVNEYSGIMREYKTYYFYNSNGSLSKKEYMAYTDRTASFYYYKKEYFSYDEEGNVSTKSIFNSSYFLDTWTTGTQYEYTYDQYGNLLQIERYYVDKLVPIILKEKRIVYYNSEFVSSIQENCNCSLKIYPQPVLDNLIIEMPDNSQALFELFSVQGCMIMSKTLYGSDQVSFEGVTRGVYIYNIRTNNGVKTGKILKK